MSVYVDDMEAPYGRMVMCHMIADTPEELREMARRIRVPLRWIQSAGTYREHFDICKSKRKDALFFGAKPVTWEQLGRMIHARRRT